MGTLEYLVEALVTSAFKWEVAYLLKLSVRADSPGDPHVFFPFLSVHLILGSKLTSFS